MNRFLLLLIIGVCTISGTLFAQRSSNITAKATISTSYVSSWENINSINDGYNPSSSTDKTGGAYGNWNNATNGDWNWVQYSWSELYKISQSDIYWWTDNGGILIPSEAYTEFWDILSNKWIKFSEGTGDGVLRNQYNTAKFKPILTNKIRVRMTSAVATGILEWKVFGEVGGDVPLRSSASIDSVLTKGLTSTITLTALDTLGAAVPNYVFHLDLIVSNAVPTTTEAYLFNGDSLDESMIDVKLPPTSAEGITTFTLTIPTVLDPTDGIIVQPYFADRIIELQISYSLLELGLVSPVFAADVSSNSVDNNLEITFEDNARWRSMVIEVSVDDSVLIPEQDYSFTEGILTLKPEGLNTALTTPGTKQIIVRAAGYDDDIIPQEIKTGNISLEKSSVLSELKLFQASRTNLIVSSRDKYDNIIKNYNFKLSIEVINSDATTAEVYTIGANKYSSGITSVDLPITDNDGITELQLNMANKVDLNDGIRMILMSSDSTNLDTLEYMNHENEKQVYVPNDVKKNPDFTMENTAQSENFTLFWGKKIKESPEDAVNGDLSFKPAEILNLLEDVLSFYVDTLHFITNPTERNMGKYKMVAVLNNTWTNGSFTGWAFGGSVDDVIGAMWVDPKAGEPYTISHELTHMMQATIPLQYPGRGFGNDAANFIWESHANFMRAQYLKTYDQDDIQRYMFSAMMQFGTTRKYYQNIFFMEYVKDKYGIEAINDMWRLAEPSQGHPLTTLRDAVLNYSQADLNDDFGYHAMKNVTWDYQEGEQMRKAEASKDPNQVIRKYTILDKKLDEPDTYIVPKHLAPADYGYNIIPLYSNEGVSDITVQFHGYDNDLAQGAGWRYGFVAIDNAGTPRYSKLHSAQDGSASFTLSTSDSLIYFVVTGAPKVHHMYNWNTSHPTSYRYPYALKFEGALPEGYKEGYNSMASKVDGAVHSNGGGFVASKATVASTVYVGPNAQVLGNANIGGNVRIEGYALVKDHATVSGNAIIRDHATVGGTAIVKDNAIVEKTSYAFDGAKITDNTVVSGSAALYHTTLSGSAICNELSWHWSKIIGGTAVMSGEVDSKSCTSGIYMQGYGRNECDGIYLYEGNVDINSEVTDYLYPIGCYPTAPSNLVGTTISSNQVLLEWDAALDDRAIKDYYVVVDGKVNSISSDTSFTLTLDNFYYHSVSVRAKDVSGNLSAESNQVRVRVTLGINDEVEVGDQSFSVCPNPSNGSIFIALSGYGSSEPVELNFYNVEGQLVHRYYMGTDREVSLDCRQTLKENAMYILEVKGKAISTIKKIVFE